MPVAKEYPPGVRPFRFHGIDMSPGGGDGEWAGECPACGKRKLHVNAETGLWRCLVCQTGGNPTKWLQGLYESAGEPTENALGSLAEDRGLPPPTLSRWGVRKSPTTGDWLIPGYCLKGTITQLYRYAKPAGAPKAVLLATSGQPASLFAPADMTELAKTKKVYVCEGPWDGMALDEALGNAGRDGAVIAVPGAGTWGEHWTGLLSAKDVVLLYDHDDAGRTGARKAARALAGSAKSISYLDWPAGKPKGWDVRDELGAADTPAAGLGGLNGWVVPAPKEWLEEGEKKLKLLDCRTYREVVDRGARNAVRWPKAGREHDHVLTCMLASILSTQQQGDQQVWLKVIGRPSCGKTTLAEWCGAAKEYVICRDTMTGLTSGYQSSEDGGDNMSLVRLLGGKTLIIKDADTILQDPGRRQIFSQFRAFYDRSIRTQYKNKMSKEWEAQPATVIICGTRALRDVDNSELGERFLDVSMSEEIDDDLEDEIGLRKLRQQWEQIGNSVNGKATTQDTPENTLVKQLCGGYVKHLRTHSDEIMRGVRDGTDPDALRECLVLGKFAAYLRARPGGEDGTGDREVGTRLTQQFGRLALCLAGALNKPRVDDDVISRVRRVAFDTALGTTAGRTWGLVHRLRPLGPAGADSRSLSVLTGIETGKQNALLRFLRHLGAVESYIPPPGPRGGVSRTPNWRLTEKFRRVFDGAVGTGGW